MDQILEVGLKAIGQRDYKKLADEKKVGIAGMIRAKCYECCCGYVDGKVDCNVPTCPLYGRMPYRGKIDGNDSKNVLEMQTS